MGLSRDVERAGLNCTVWLLEVVIVDTSFSLFFLEYRKNASS